MDLRRRMAVVLAVLMVAATTACGSSTGSGGQTTLKIWDYSAEQVEFHKKVTEQFTREHPGIKVEWRSITQAEYKKTLLLSFQSRQAPDIFYWSDNGPLAMAGLLDQQWIKPLAPDGKLPADFTARWPEGSFAEGINVSEGKTYGFPFSESVFWGPGYMYMNNKVFKDAGLDPASPPRTWTELKQACAKVKSATKAECIANPVKARDFQRLFYALTAGTFTMTDTFFDLRNGKFALNEPQALKAFEFIQELSRDGYLAPGTNDKDFSRQQFAAGQAAIYLDGTWMPSVWASQGFKGDQYTVAGHPNPDSGSAGALPRQHDGNKYWVSSQSQQHDAAWKLFEWMTKPDGYFVQEYFKAGLGTLAFADNAKYVTDPAVKQIMQVAGKPGFRAQVPVPVLKCPDLAKSKAYVDAIGKRPDWEYEAMVEALVGKEPLAPLANELVTERQKILESKLGEEAAKGLKVSIDCYKFPDWDYTKDYGLDRYQR
jgi:ABC-type glycerol-3-phosphate transport system substrate-binding protein